jgi:hypothetical protein
VFSDEFIDHLPVDAHEAARLLCDVYYETDSKLEPGQETNDANYFAYVKAHAIFQALVEAYELPVTIPPLTRDRKANVAATAHLVSSVAALAENEYVKSTVRATKLKFAAKMGKTFHYEFSEGDLERGQKLLNEIRVLISKSSVFDEPHKRRLLDRLERVQSEFHKKVSDLDRFWGLIGDAGVARGKFGNDAKPIVDRIRELTSLVWATQARAEGLPSNCPPPPSLPPPSPEVPPTPPGSEPPSIDI